MRASLARVIALLVPLSCAPAQPPRTAAPPAPDPIVTTETLAFQAEHDINAADEALDQLQPDTAVEKLEAAHKALTNPNIDNYPDAANLRKRHQELSARVPIVRAEVKKREIAAGVAAAKEKIEAARANLKAAIAEIKKKNPDEGMLSAAEAAVDAMKAAIDEAAKLEPLDLQYAKYSLAARKDSRTQREAIDQRRHDVSVEHSRVEIAAAVGELNGALKRIQSKDVADEDFATARTAANVLKQTLDRGQQLAMKNAKHSAHIAQVKSRLENDRKSIDAREHRVTVDRQKARVEDARKALAAALAPLNAKDVVEGQFDEATRATQLVNKTLDEGKSLASKDKDYAAYATQVGLRIQEATARIEQRKIEVQVAHQIANVEEGRRGLAAALAALKGNDVPDEKMSEAEGAVANVAKMLDAAAFLGDKDKKYATYQSEVRKRLEEATAKIATRRLEVAVWRQKRELESSRTAVAQTIKQLGARDPADELFEEAKTAVTVLEKTLDASDSLTVKDRVFAQYVLDTRKSMQASRQTIETRRLEVDLMRQRARVEEGRKGLAEALAELKGNDVPAEKFDLADGAVKNVAKLLDDGARLGDKDQKYAVYAGEVKKRLEEATAKIAARRLEVEIWQQRARVNEALAAMKQSLNRLNAAPDVQETEAAVAELEKTLDSGEQYGAKDGAYSKFAVDARKNATDARKRIQARRDDIAMDTQKTKVEGEVETLRGAMAALEGSPEEPQFKAAKDALNATTQALDAGGELERKLPRYATYALQMRKTLADMKQKIEKRKIEIAVRDRKLVLEELLAASKTSVGNAKQVDATSATIKEAGASLKSFREEIMKSAVLEKQDSNFETFANNLRKNIERFQAELDEAKHAVAFREGPIAAITEGLSAAESASSLSPLEKKNAYSNALDRFQACQRDSATIIGDAPRLGGVDFYIGANKTKAKNVLALCAQHAKTTEAKLTSAKAHLAFYEGPARSFEAAKSLKHKNQLPEALSQFEACLETGRILQHKHPELLKEEFELNGDKLTLPGVVTTCQQQAKSLRSSIHRKEN